MGGAIGHRIVDAALLTAAVVVAVTLATGRAPAATTRSVALADQLGPCVGAGGFVPSACVSLPQSTALAGPAPEVVDLRRHGCAALRDTDTPGFCLALPSADQGDAEVERTTALDHVRALLGTSFHRASTGVVGAWIENGIDGRDESRIRAALGGDVAAVESLLGRRFVVTPTVIAFASRASFVRGLEGLLGYAPVTAELLGADNGGVLVTDLGAVLLAWESLRAQRPLVTPRHELTHVLVHQLAGIGEIPAWLDEGLAVLAQRTAADQPTLDADRYRALAAVRSGRAGLDSLSSAAGWPRRNAELRGLAYAIAAEAASILVDDLTAEGVVRVLERVGAGATFADAYRELSGRSVADLVAAFPATLVARLGERGIAVGTPRSDANTEWVLYGFAPGTTAEITVEGAGYRVGFIATVDADGIFDGTFGATAPPGEYVLSALADGVSVHARLRTR